MGLFNPSAVYGIVRGIDDARESAQKTQAFETDQRIRLRQEETAAKEAPLRMRALETQASEGEATAKHNAALRPLQLGAAELTQKKGKLELDQYMKSVGNRTKLDESIRRFDASGNPQVVMDTLSEIYPEMMGATVAKSPDGSIVITRKDGSQQIFPATIENAAGQKVSAADQFAMFATGRLDPIKNYTELHAADLKLRGELAKKDADYTKALDVEDIRDRRALKREGRIETAARQRRLDSGLRTLSSGLRATLKTNGIPGSMALTYSDNDDAALLPIMQEKASTYYKENFDAPEMSEDKARRYGIDTVREAFAPEKKQALEIADRLVKAGINPRDKESLKAAGRGNADAVLFARLIQRLTQKLGDSAVAYLLSQMPEPKKK